MKAIHLIFIGSLLTITTLCHGAVRLPSLVSDGLVLQRNQPVAIWGWADSGEKVSIHFRDKNYTTITGADGKWLITLAPMQPGGPFEMKIDASNHIAIQNIAVGDVWICSGQSNMALTMERVKEKYPDVIAHSDNAFIRNFFLPTRYNFHQPEDDVPTAHWEIANPANVLNFGAVAYFFARSLYEKYKVPIGLINTSVGGSPAEAWLSADALRKFPEHLAIAQRYARDGFIDSIRASDNTTRDNWYKELQAKDKGQLDKPKWYDPSYNTTTWPEMILPSFWDEGGLPAVNGVAWFRKEFEIPPGAAGKEAKLLLGRIVDRDSAFVNGTFVGTISYQYPPRRYTIPAGVLKEGKNVIVVRVINSANRGGFIKDKPYQITVAGTTIDLKGKWQYQLGATMKPLPDPTFFQYKPGGLYNAMIAPLLNMGIKGVIWYQGEANTSRPTEYEELMKTLIADWRSKWHAEVPFLYVQLANFQMPKAEPTESNWAALRESQRKLLNLPNTAMAVAIDLGEWNDIHPLNKEAVGTRLALGAEAIAYHDKHVVYSGPQYQSMEIKGSKVILHFSNAGTALVSRDGKELRYFAIAGADGKYVWGRAEIKGNDVMVWNDAIASPVSVRYAWADNPQDVNFYNREGLPASPFSTATGH